MITLHQSIAYLSEDCSEVWENEAKTTHLKSLSDFYLNITLSINFLIQLSSRNPSILFYYNNWKEISSFILLPKDLHALLVDQIKLYTNDTSSLLKLIQKTDTKNLLAYKNISDVGHVSSLIDIIVSRRTEISKSFELLECAELKFKDIQLYSLPNKNHINIFLYDATEKLIKKIKSVLERITFKSDIIISDLFGKGISLYSSTSGDIAPTKIIPRVRNILENLKVIIIHSFIYSRIKYYINYL